MKRVLKLVLNIVMVFSFTTVLARQDGRGPKEKLTEEQRQCMESILGKPGEGERPSHEAHQAALKQCNISQDNEHRRHHRPPPFLENISEEQASCLESKLGKPEDGQRPSRDELQTASAECGISVPDLPEERE